VILLSRLPALERLAGFEALTILADSRVLSTRGFPRRD
jgi:hypothetical protein